MVLYGESSYGEVGYGGSYDRDIIDSLSPDLMKYLPKYYETIREVIRIQEAASKQLGIGKLVMQDVLNQFFVDTATWGLSYWEKLVGLPIDNLKPLEQRRSVVKSKLRGAGTTTKQMIQDVALAFSGGEVEVIEKPSEHAFTIKFVGTKGIPPNMPDLTKTIESIKPAHLVFDYAYTYLVWQEATKLTWTQASNITWSELRVFD